MAKTNSNDVYLSIGGQDFSGLFTQVEIEKSVATTDATAGSGVDGVQRLSGLTDVTLTATIYFDTAFTSAQETVLSSTAAQTVIYGPEGSTSGLPKFECSMILTSITGPNTMADRSEMKVLELELVQADVPTATIEGGSTFA